MSRIRLAATLIAAGLCITVALALCLYSNAHHDQFDQTEHGGPIAAERDPANTGLPSPDSATASQLKLLREIRDAQRQTITLLKEISGNVRSRRTSSREELPPTSPLGADTDAQWRDLLRDSELRLTASAIVSLRARLLTQVNALKFDLAGQVEPDDPNYTIVQRRLQRTEEALRRLLSVRTPEDLALFRSDFHDTIPP